MTPLVRCPTCKKPFDPRQSNAMPFCTPRCRQIDLNRWLNEEISLPVSETSDDDHRERTDRDEDE